MWGLAFLNKRLWGIGGGGDGPPYNNKPKTTIPFPPPSSISATIASLSSKPSKDHQETWGVINDNEQGFNQQLKTNGGMGHHAARGHSKIEWYQKASKHNPLFKIDVSTTFY